VKNIFSKTVAIAATLAGAWLAGSTGLRAQQQPMTPEDHKQRGDDHAVAQKHHLKFSAVPAVYCKTPAAVAAIATISDEINEVNRFIQQDLYYDVTAVDGSFEVTKHRKLASGAEGELASLNRIKKRLEGEYRQLMDLPPCVVGYGTAFANGVFLGLYVIKATGGAVITERFIRSDQITNQFQNSHDPAGVGINVAYGFTPWHNNVVVSPFVSLDYLNNGVNHNFAGGSYLGTTANVAGTAGIKIGPSITAGFWMYGIAGVSALNEALNVNFLPVMSSTSKTVAGATLGAGFAFRPGFLQNWGRPVSLFAEYHHTWWQDAQFNSPAASPLFNYNFRREDDVIKLGFNVHFDEPVPMPAPQPGIYVKTPTSR
jgi:hypothetical protein